MPRIKTAISIDKELFEQIQRIARKTQVSRSRLFELAATDWVKKQKQKMLTNQINAAVENDTDDKDDPAWKKFMNKHRTNLVEKNKWEWT
jgi:predicted transcriptional regulator